MADLILPECACKRCGHRWVPRIRDPVQCPKCKSARWQDIPTRPKRRIVRRG